MLDLLPALARAFFARRLPASLSFGQAAILAALGLQQRGLDDVVAALGLPANQVLALFNKARTLTIRLGFMFAGTRPSWRRWACSSVAWTTWAPRWGCSLTRSWRSSKRRAPRMQGLGFRNYALDDVGAALGLPPTRSWRCSTRRALEHNITQQALGYAFELA